MNVRKFKQKIEKSKAEKKDKAIPKAVVLLFLLALFFAIQVFFVGIITVELFKPGSLENTELHRKSPQYTSVQSTASPGAGEVVGNF